MKKNVFRIQLLTSLWVFLIIPWANCQEKNGHADGEPAPDEKQKTLQSLAKLDDHPLFRMTYYGDYSLTKPIQVSADSGDLPPNDWACSLFAALGDSERPLFGRNFDWQDNPALVLFTDTSTGYATVSMVDISYFGYSAADKKLETIEGRARLLQAPLLPFDGMNEHGLVVGMAAVDQARVPNDPNKPTTGSLRIIRLVLDQCKSVPEALRLFESYNIDFSGGPQIHYLLADADGRSALVELSNDKMHIHTSNDPWQAATNFHFVGNEKNATNQCHRYAKIQSELSQQRGRMDLDQSLSLLHAVSQENTRWSAVYDLKDVKLNLVMSRHYDQPIELRLTDHRPGTGN